MIVDRAVHTAMIDHMVQAAPLEGCGLLAGPRRIPCPRDTDGDGDCGRLHCPDCARRVDRWIPMSNVSDFPRLRYEMDPEELLATWQGLDDEGRRPWVVVHSHTTSASTTALSETDLRMAADTTLRHAVVSLGGTHPAVALWRVGHGARPVKMPLQVVDLQQRSREESWTTDLTRDVSTG